MCGFDIIGFIESLNKNKFILASDSFLMSWNICFLNQYVRSGIELDKSRLVGSSKDSRQPGSMEVNSKMLKSRYSLEIEL